MTEITYCNHSIHLKLLTDGEVGIGGDRWPAANKFCELVSNKKLNKTSKHYEIKKNKNNVTITNIMKIQLRFIKIK